MKASSELVRLRELCSPFPEVVEVPNGVGKPAFKVGGKIFVMHLVDHHGDGKTDFGGKARHGAQDALTSSDPEHYFIPPYVGCCSSVEVRLNRPVDWAEARGCQLPTGGDGSDSSEAVLGWNRLRGRVRIPTGGHSPRA